MFLKNLHETRSKKIINLAQLDKFFAKFDLVDDEVKAEFTKYFEKGETVYWAYNPYLRDLYDEKVLMYSLNEDELNNKYGDLRDEV